jgi:hypothetical protein
MRFLQSGLKGVTYGLAAWLLYGMVETLLPLSTQLWRQPEFAVMPWQWTSIAVLIGAYAFMGIAFGAAAGLVLTLVDRDRTVGNHQLSAVLTITCAFGLHEIVGKPHASYQYLDVRPFLNVISVILN